MNYYEKNSYSKGKEYCLKGNTPEIEAVQWLGGNTDEVLAFSKVNTRRIFNYEPKIILDKELIINCSVYDRIHNVNTSLGSINIPLYGYLIRLKENYYIVCPSEIFEQLFERKR